MKLRKPNILTTSAVAIQSALIVHIASEEAPSFGEKFAIVAIALSLPLLVTALLLGLGAEETNSKRTQHAVTLMALIGCFGVCVSLGGVIWGVSTVAGKAYVFSVVTSLLLLLILTRKATRV
jgi:hypothetical protein